MTKQGSRLVIRQGGETVPTVGGGCLLVFGGMWAIVSVLTLVAAVASTSGSSIGGALFFGVFAAVMVYGGLLLLGERWTTTIDTSDGTIRSVVRSMVLKGEDRTHRLKDFSAVTIARRERWNVTRTERTITWSVDLTHRNKQAEVRLAQVPAEPEARQMARAVADHAGLPLG